MVRTWVAGILLIAMCLALAPDFLHGQRRPNRKSVNRRPNAARSNAGARGKRNKKRAKKQAPGTRLPE